ncbi:GNAT family N-acetyltransferase [Calycomorphotria hydatis]|uniref:BioF2-like acetyltransferase domain-containing protein n=1 Tax=Calycomorphotria hydatis TaxID=2528027 RepID=A0A517TCS8_9PLAN|nr:GNAT family N-acetyltransferase [Calycomorphotria hydatis]QDT66168.1 hypothetical protein V22_34330 [Calycomorphotria hydatis]
MTHVELIKPSALSSADQELWMQLLKSEAEVASPFLTPTFCRLTDEVRGDIWVAILKEGGESVGYFPFQQRRPGRAEPVAWPMSDYQALIVKPGISVSPMKLVRLCGMHCWKFDHLLVANTKLEKFCLNIEPSPYLDLSDGFEAYHEERKKAGSKRIKQVNRKARKLERDHGELTVEVGGPIADAFERMLDWKSEQYRRTGIFDLLSRDWTIELLRKVHETSSKELSGLMFTLRLNGEPIAVDLGMKTNGIHHSWFTAFDREYLSYGTGHILTVRMAEAAESLGIKRIDLGKGPEEYKASFQSGVTMVGMGAVDRRPFVNHLRRGWDVTERTLKESMLADTLRKPARALKSWRRSLATTP